MKIKTLFETIDKFRSEYEHNDYLDPHKIRWALQSIDEVKLAILKKLREEKFK